MPDFMASGLSNGLRLLHIPSNGKVVHAGVFINAGTRDEDPSLNGLAHFIEHTLFKGTSRRKSYHILTRLENVGGDLNAFTTKEETCVYATVLERDFERAMELLADVIFHSTFPEKELKKEKEVILDEINSYKDTPSEEIYDVFEEQLFPGHALGMNILGTREHLLAFTRDHARAFTDHYYRPSNMLLCTAGNLPFSRVEKLAGKYFGEPGPTLEPHRRELFANPVRFETEMKKNTYQVHGIIGGLAYDRKDGRRIPMYLLNNILGGPAMNSRLNLAIRERHGYAYNIESVFLPYTDTGVWSIYLGTDPVYLDRVLDLVQREIRRLREERLGTLQLSQAVRQLTGQMAIANESPLNRMFAMGKTYLHDGRLDTAAELERKVQSVTADRLMEVAVEVMRPENLSRLIFRP